MPDIRRLRTEEFSFHGFDGLSDYVERFFQSIHIRTGTPTVEVVDGGVIVPTTPQPAGLSGHQPEMHGGILRADGRPVALANLHRRGGPVYAGITEPTDIAPARELDEELIYLGWTFPHHYGVFLLESLARTWFLREADPKLRVAFYEPAKAPEGTARRILELMDIPRGRIFVPKQATRVRRISVPEPLYELYLAAHERAVEPFRAVAERVLGTANPTPSEQPVYVSRRRMTSDRRTIVGEAELEELLLQNKFRVVYPEKLTLDDQVRLFNQHADVFAGVGSAVHNVLFALNRPRLHLLTPGVPEQDFFLVSAVAGAKTTFLNCLGKWEGPATPLLLDVPPLIDYLVGRGFVTGLSASRLARRQRLLHRRYEEVTLYGRVREATRAGDVLPVALESTALEKAATSWPLSWALAQYFAARDEAKAAELAEQFVASFGRESDAERIAHQQKELLRGATGVVTATANAQGRAAAARLVNLLVERNVLNASVRQTVEHLVAEADPQGIGRPISAAGGATARAVRVAPTNGPAVPPNGRAAPESEGGAPRTGRSEPANGGGSVVGPGVTSVLIVNMQRDQLLPILPTGGTVAEIGVFRGLFSRKIVDTAKPKTLHLIDPWSTESGSTPAEGRVMPEAYDLVQSGLRGEIASGRVVLHREASTVAAATFPDSHFDWIYVDAMHDYAQVLADLLAFKDKVKPDGFVLGHDFSAHSRARRYDVGVIRAVREFAANEGFKLVLVTNEDHPSFLMARSGNTTTLPALQGALLGLRVPRPVAVDEGLLDRFAQIDVTYPDGRVGQIMQFG